MVEPVKKNRLRHLLRKERRIQRLMMLLVVLVGLPGGFWIILHVREDVATDSPFVKERQKAEWKKKGESPVVVSGGVASSSAASGSRSGGAGGPENELARPPNQLISKDEMAQAKQEMQQFAAQPQPQQAQPQAQPQAQQAYETRTAIKEPENSEEQSINVVELGPIKVGNGRLGNSLLGQRRFFAEILNQGQSVVTQVAVVIAFTNGQGGVVEQRMLNPLAISTGVFGDTIKPLRAGEIRTFGTSIDDVPSGWDGGVRLSIQGIQPLEPVVEAPLAPPATPVP
ncbi:hypothetical protein Mmc1_0499 [Magnetococcus marinus MC-1]|uniref:Uncharacterized protein n=1 Tax=Magnetococcus marinus (strain ATCC BAA-1437 / JCM 17883 / MC-1) TaxID=156889 RepID=A0L4Y1_MAGMM|nr:hypothetical protein [Magnetococcus marinus]ABK43024.1 hypothetical protein Mmc1_0499 [Magnetococcus marinus MC-1]